MHFISSHTICLIPVVLSKHAKIVKALLIHKTRFKRKFSSGTCHCSDHSCELNGGTSCFIISAKTPLAIQPPTFFHSLRTRYSSRIKQILKHYFHGSKGIAIFVGGPWSEQLSGIQVSVTDLRPGYNQIKHLHVCDALVLTQDKPPVFITFLRCNSQLGQNYARKTARFIKCCISTYIGIKFSVCFMAIDLYFPLDFCLKNAVCNFDVKPMPHISGDQGRYTIRNSQYPRLYSDMDESKYTALTDALTVCLLAMPSGFCNRIGAQYLNILTEEQFNIVWEAYHFVNHLLVIGPAGSGKTVVGASLIQRLKVNCRADEILYVTAHIPSVENMK